jgi:DNA polymerase III subunit beta
MENPMKLSIDRAALLRALNHVQSVVERRNTIPILANVKLDARKDKGGDMFSFVTTDMDLEMNEAIAAKVSEPGATTVPALMLHDIVRKLPEGSPVELTLDASGNTMSVKSGRSNFKLGCLPVSDFPELGSDTASAASFALKAVDLRALIDRTKFAMSADEARYYLNGIYLHATEHDGVNVLRAVATDGHRLARFEMPLPDGAKDMAGVIIPRKAVMELRKLIEEAADTIHVSLTANKIRFAFDHIVLTTKLIDGTFPDYQRVIPAANDKMVEVDPKVFSSAIDRVSTISDGKTRAVKITLGGKAMTISASSPESGSATEDIEVHSEITPMEIGFNARYLLDITGQVDGEACRLKLADAMSPTIIEDTSDASALYVIMPLRV